MSVTVEILDPRHDGEPAGWGDFRRQVSLQPVWDYGLLGIEAWLARNPPVLGVIRDERRILGACVVLVCRTWRGRAFAPHGRARTARLARLRPRWAEVYLPLLSGYPACVFRDNVDDAIRRDALRAFERELLRTLGPGLLGVVYRAMGERLAGPLSGRGRVLREIDPTAVLPNRWESGEQWLSTLDPRLRAAIDRLGADDTMEVSTGTARGDLDATELAALLNAHRARADERAWRSGQRARIGGLHLDTRSPVPAAYLDAFVRRTDVVTRVYRDRGGRLLGFNTMIDHPVSSAVHHWAALPARRGGRAGLHLDAYAHCVRRMIERGRPELTAGRTLLAAKAGLGFGTRTLVSVAVPRPVLGR